MKAAMARPLVRCSPYMSAMIPATMAIGALANTPTKSLNMRKAGQLGARAHAIVHIQNIMKVPMTLGRRPNCSVTGAQIIGPRGSQDYELEGSGA